MYYGLFIKVSRNLIRVDTTTGYTEETAKVKFAGLMKQLRDKGVTPILRKLPPVKQISVTDKGYARND